MTERRESFEFFGVVAAICAGETIAILAGCNPHKVVVIAWGVGFVVLPLMFWRWSRMRG